MYHLEILEILKEEVSNTSLDTVHDVVASIYKAGGIFIAGAGRSKLVANMFAMRLMQCGFRVHVVGDAATPSINFTDLLLVVSGSGKTSQLVDFVVKAKAVSAKTCLITSSLNSSLRSLCDVSIQIGSEPRTVQNVLPLGSRFELSTLIFLESLIMHIMKDNDWTDKDLQRMHANLE